MKTSKMTSLVTDFGLSDFHLKYLLLDTVLSNPSWHVPNSSTFCIQEILDLILNWEGDHPENVFS